MQIKTSHASVNMHFTYDEGDEKALTQTEIILKEVITALQKEECNDIESIYGSVTLDELNNALHTIQELLYEVPAVIEAW